MEYAKNFKELARISTGAHFLDSGRIYGRHWEKPAIPNDMPLEYAVDYGDVGDEAWLELRVSAAVLLDTYLKIDQKATDQFRQWAAMADPGNDLPWSELAIIYCKLMVETGRWKGLEGRPLIGNSYNTDNQLDQDFFFVAPNFAAEHALIQMHNGCDVRGGYTAPVVAYGDLNEVLLCWRLAFWCPQCGEEADDLYAALRQGWRFVRASDKVSVNVVCPCGAIAYRVPIAGTKGKE